MTQPSIFVSHGAPSIAIEQTQAHHALRKLSSEIEKPAAVVVVSAHFETDAIQIVSDPEPATVYDFGGFDPALYQIRYQAKGSPALAETALKLLQGAGIGAVLNPSRGFDHGVWTPLYLAFPAADIPVLQISIQPHKDARHHFEIGKALAQLRKDNILLMGSGHITHNLGAVFGAMRHGRSSPEMAGQVSAFVEWTEQKLIQNDMENLLDWENQAPFAKVNHPTSEHFLPLFFSAGAGQLVDQTTAKAKLLHRSTQFGMFTSDIWRFD